MPARALPPQQVYQPTLINVAAEASLLGALLSDKSLGEALSEKLTPADFYDALHQQIFEAAIARIDAGQSATPITLRPLFDGDAAGYLAELTQLDGGLYAGEHAGIVLDLAKRRRLTNEARAMLEAAARPGENNVDDLCRDVDLAMSTALGSGTVTDENYSLAQLFDATVAQLDDEFSGRAPQGIKVDFVPDFNDVVGGSMRPGELIILAGRPGMGKTAAALTVSLGAAANDHGTLVISREMKALQLGRRILADLIFDHGMSPKFDTVKRGNFSSFDRERMAEARKRIADWPWHVTDSRRVTVDRLGSTIRRYKRLLAAQGKQLKLVVIDYLQLMRADKARSKIYEEISDVSRMLKAVALDEGITILALAQLSRKVEERDDKRPILSDLRDSGQIEQDADAVVFLYRDEYYLQQRPKKPDDKGYEAWMVSMEAAADRLEFIGAKVRDGALMRKLCWFFADRQAVRGSRYFEERRT